MTRHNSNYYASPDQLTFFGEIKQTITASINRALDTKKVADPKRKLAAYPENMRIDQVAAYLNCSEKKIRILIEEGKLEAIDLSADDASRKCLRVKRDSVAAYETAASTKALQ